MDQCQIKLKNLKAQYRYIKERIPQVGHLDLEDDEVLQRLVFECEARGISPYYTKHLRYLKRFLAGLTGSSKAGNKRRKPGPGGYSHTSRYLNPAAASSSSSSSTPAVAVAVAVTSSSSTPSSSSTSGYVSTGFSPGLGLASSAEPVGAAKLSLDSIRRAGSGIVKRPGASSLPPIRISEARVLEAAPGSRKRSRRGENKTA